MAQGGEHIGGVTSNPRERVRKSLTQMLTSALVTIAKSNPELVAMALRIHNQMQRDAEKSEVTS